MAIEAPKEWEISKFEDTFSRITNKASSVPATLYQDYGKFPVIDQGKEKFAGFVNDESLVYTCPEDGLIVFGDHTRIVKFVDRNFVLGADGTQLLQPKDGFNAKYLYYLLSSKQIPNTGYNRHYKFLNEMYFVKPSITEQILIAKALSDVDAVISLLKVEHSKNLAIKSGMASQLLRGKLRISGFADEWHEVFLFEQSIVKARIGWQGLNSTEYLSIGKFGLVGGTDFEDGHLNWGSIFFVSEERYQQDPHIQLANNDVLITKDGTIGKIAFVTNLTIPTTLNSGVYVVRPRNRSYIPSFAYHLLNSTIFDQFIEKLSAGSTISHLYQRDLKNFIVKIPKSLEEQGAIAESLTAIDKKLTSLASELAKYECIKQGMAHDLLTGKARLV